MSQSTAAPPVVTDRYVETLTRLSASSVTRHFDAYADVAWDDPAMRLDPDDARLELAPDDPLGATDWYRAQPAGARSRIGLHLMAHYMKVGVEFENILSRGLLEFTEGLEPGAPEYRYALHEVIEEGQHSLMFQEFVHRSGARPRGMHPFEIATSRGVPSLGRTFPELFFLHVLAGEVPIDHMQRAMLASGRGLHPLLARVLRIHVTEEARHVHFARMFLERRVPSLGPVAMTRLRVSAPIVLGTTASAMVRLPADLIARYGLPREVVRAVHGSAAHRARVTDGLRPVSELCARLGVLTPAWAPLWRLFGIIPPASTRLLHSAPASDA